VAADVGPAPGLVARRCAANVRLRIVPGCGAVRAPDALPDPGGGRGASAPRRHAGAGGSGWRRWQTSGARPQQPLAPPVRTTAVMQEPPTAMIQPSTEHKITPRQSAPVAEPVTTGVVPKRSGGSRKADVIVFLREALANGHVAAKELEQRAVEAGLLDASNDR
jgi:hypothetical protein